MLMSCAEEVAAGSSEETSSNTAHGECCQLIPKPSCVELTCALYLMA